MTKEPRESKEGLIARNLRAAREIRDEPRVVVPRVRGFIAKLWVAKGGGFFGLGYVVTFITFEVKTFAGSFVGGSSASEFVSGFIADQALHYVLRVSVESLLNAFLALLWPIYVLEWLGGLGILALVGGYFAFAHLVRPSIETWIPELKSLRDERARLKREKRDRKRAGHG